MFTTLKNAWKVAELRQKMLFTVIILVLFRLGSVIPVPYFDSGILQATFQSAEGSVFQYLNILSGEAFARGTLFALSVSPYITAQIIMQLSNSVLRFLSSSLPAAISLNAAETCSISRKGNQNRFE